MFIDLRGRKEDTREEEGQEGRDRETSMSICCLLYVPRLGIEPTT